MITTVTTTTVTSFAVAASLALVVIVGLLAILVSKEVIGDRKSERVQRIGEALNVAVIPLAIVFGVTVLVKVLEVIG